MHQSVAASLSQMFQHQYTGPQRANWIDNALPGSQSQAQSFSMEEIPTFFG